MQFVNKSSMLIFCISLDFTGIVAGAEVIFQQKSKIFTKPFGKSTFYWYIWLW